MILITALNSALRLPGTAKYWLQVSPSTVREEFPEITDYQSILDNPDIAISELEPAAQDRAFVTITNRLRQDALPQAFADFVHLARESFAKPQSTIEVTVTKGDQCQSGWRLQVGNQVFEDREGREASVAVAPAHCLVLVTGVIDGKTVQAEKGVNVKAGEIQKVELTLA